MTKKEILKEESWLIFLEFGTVILTNIEGEKKVIHREEDIQTAFKLADKGLVPEWICAD